MDYFELTNKIKGNFTKDWMTPSQSKVFEQIKGRYASQSIINIYGDSGVGKTFLAWNLEHELNAKYIKDISELMSHNLLVIDDCPHNRNYVRDLIQESFFYDINKIIFFTDKKAEDDVTKINLELTEEDKVKFKNNLWRSFDFVFNVEKFGFSLNSLIKYNGG